MTAGGWQEGIAAAVQAHKGAGRTIRTLEDFLSTHDFSLLGSVKVNGYHEGEVLANKEAVGKARKIGDTIVRLVNPDNH